MGRLRRFWRWLRRRKRDEPERNESKTPSSPTESTQSVAHSDPQPSAASTQSEAQPDSQPSESEDYYVWYRHTGEDLPSDHWWHSYSYSSDEMGSAQQILEDVGEQDITHLSITNKLPSSLKDIAPNLTHLCIFALEDHSHLDSLRELMELKVLHLMYNDFSSGLPSVIGEMKSLTELSILYCKLTDLPDNLRELKELKVLRLLEDEFSNGLPSVIGELKSLVELHLPQSKLTDLPDNIRELKQLKILNIDDADFSKGLPEVITKRTSLTELSLPRCHLTSLPPSMSELNQLKVLELGGNDFPKGLPEVIPKLTSLTELSLKDCGLTSLPQGFGKLQQLEVLDLERSKLSMKAIITGLPESMSELKRLKILKLGGQDFSGGLPEVIPQLTSLTELSLMDCQLTSLPSSMSELRRLKILNLANNRFTKGLPKVITQLKSLTKLSLDICDLTSLPPRIGQLQQLEKLGLKRNSFSNGLSNEIGDLNSLTELDLAHCSLTDLPQSVSELRQLKILNLAGNPFTKGLPEVITQLKSLTELSLNRCDLASLPPRIGQLQQLEQLDLMRNNFSNGLSNEIGDLNSLTKLDLADCSLTDLPQRMSKLENLRYLDLSRNSFVEILPVVFDLNALTHLNLNLNLSLSEIDKKVLQLKYLYQLDCSMCESLRSPPYQVCRQGIPAIRSYFAELAKGVEVSTIPVAIIGNSLSGKTSIVRSLKEGKRELTYRDKASPLDEITKVFNVEELKFSKSHVRLIDYGGQEIYHIAYHLALKEQCVPLIVVNIFEFFTRSSADGYEKATRHVCFDWLCHLYLACPNLGRPLLALTHTDKLSAEELRDSKDALKKTVHNIRRKWLEEEDRCKDLFEAKFKQIKHLSNVDLPIFLEEDIFEFNDDTNITSNIECLKENIGRRCLSLEHNIPQRWKEVSAFLEKASDEPYMEFSAIMKQFPDMDCKTALEYMHHTGKILWFQRKTDGHDELATYIFHQIPTITKMMALLLHHSPEEMKRDCLEKFREFTYKDTYIGRAKYEKLLKEFLSTGVLDESLFYNLVVSDSGFDFKVAAQLLRCFHIVHGPFKLRVSKTPRDVYTVPCFATEPMDHSWKTVDHLQLRLDIVFNGLPLPKYAYQLMSVTVLNKADQFDIVHARSNGAIAKHDGNATYLCHDPKVGKVTLQVSSSIEQLRNSWVRLRKTAKDIIDMISKRWEATRVEVIHYCTHCLFLRDDDPGIEIKPDWFSTEEMYDGLQPVACYKGEERTVPKPLMFPCSNFSSEEKARLGRYLKELQFTRSSST